MNTADQARRIYELYNAGDADGIAALVAEDYIENDPLPGQGMGRDGMRDRAKMLIGALAPQFTVEDVICEGDRVVVRWTQAGTHVGEFFAGVPATGKSFAGRGIDIYRVGADGLFAEHWHEVDVLSILVQLGVIPEPG